MAIKKSKSGGTFWSYQLDSTANPTLCSLAGSSKTALRILSFSIVMVAIVILAEIHCYLRTLKSRHNNLFLNGVTRAVPKVPLSLISAYSLLNTHGCLCYDKTKAKNVKYFLHQTQCAYLEGFAQT